MKFLLSLLTSFSFFLTFSQEQIPANEPGSTDYLHEDVAVINSGNQAGDFLIFLPDLPRKDSANVIFYFHGLSQSNPGTVSRWIEHTVRKGNIFVFARYHGNNWFIGPQKMLDNGAQSIQNVLNYFEEHPEITQPILEKSGIMGHSFGATMAANYAVNYDYYGFPKPKFVMPVQPGNFPVLSLGDYSDLDSDIKMLTIVGNSDIFVGAQEGKRIFNKGPRHEFNNLVVLNKDQRGNPVITGGHEAPLMLSNNQNLYTNDMSLSIFGAFLITRKSNADNYCFWKLSEAVINCAFENEDCHFAFGNTPEQRYMGTFNNGTLIKELTVLTHDPERKSLESSNNSIKVYPNPFLEYVLINKGDNDPILSLDVIDINGQKVYSSSGIESHSITLSREIFPKPGIYFIN